MLTTYDPSSGIERYNIALRFVTLINKINVFHMFLSGSILQMEKYIKQHKLTKRWNKSSIR